VSEENVELIRRLNALFNAGDYEAMTALFAPDAEILDHTPLPDMPSSVRGHDEMRSLLQAWTSGFSGFTAEMVGAEDLGDFVVGSTRWRFVAAGTGIETTWTGAEAWEVRDGRVAWGQVGFRDRAAAEAAVRSRRGG
jgi:ketosteroid isomerase-like protein